MDRKIVWSTNAALQLNDIFLFVSRDSLAYASGVIFKIEEAVDTLPLFPQMGRRVPEISRSDYREILVYKWRIVYQIRDDEIEIIGILHGAQRLMEE